MSVDVDVFEALVATGFQRGEPLAVSAAAGVGIGIASATTSWAVSQSSPVVAAGLIGAIDEALRPQWVWWSNETARQLIDAGVRVSKCWDLSAVHRLIFGGWASEPSRVWAMLHDLSTAAIPAMGQLDLMSQGTTADEGGDPEDPVRPDVHLRPEWTSGGWASTPKRLASWAATAFVARELQRERLARTAMTTGPARASRAEMTARSESGAELLCAELAVDGLPIDVDRAESIIATFLGPRPRTIAEANEARRQRDATVLSLPGVGTGTDLRNPAHVRSMLDRVGVDVPDTRAWRLEAFRESSPVVDALLTWRKAERIETTFGYAWLDQHVASDAHGRTRLRGSWTGSDGAAGRMTAQAGLHNMPADLRGAVAAEPGHVFVRADLGQIEPRVLAAVSGDRELAAAAANDDMYAPVAARLGVERAVAKVAVLAAMYGQTSGAAGLTLRAMETGYPVAMQYLRTADEAGRAGNDVVTFGGRRIRMWQLDDEIGARPNEERAAMAARGRFARNAVVQGAAAELFKAWAATVRARSAVLGATIVLCLHDELLVHAPAQHGQAVAALLDDCLAEAASRWAGGGSEASPVRFVAETSVIAVWSDAKP